MGLVRVRDAAPGAPGYEFEIELSSAVLTASELIRGRVIAELARTAGERHLRPLVEQSPEERSLNGPRPGPRAPDPEQAVGRALAAFEAGRYVVLVDGRQVQSADELVRLTPDSEVTFVRLVPLRGG